MLRSGCRNAPYPPSPEANHPISNDPDYWYRQIGPDKFKSTYLKVVGGTTWHWLGTCLRFVPNDFRLSTAYGRGVDWPVTHDDLEPLYSQAEDEVGVSGDFDETLGSPRSKGIRCRPSRRPSRTRPMRCARNRDAAASVEFPL
jgi:glucose dehydrogenase